MSKKIITIQLLCNGGYGQWANKPKFPITVKAYRKGGGYMVLASEMQRIGYYAPLERFFNTREATEKLPIPEQLAINSELGIPLNQTRLPKRRNPQAVRSVGQLDNGVFRINGLFDGKARICHVHISPTHVRIVPINPCLISKTLTHKQMKDCLDSDRISVMCMERF